MQTLGSTALRTSQAASSWLHMGGVRRNSPENTVINVASISASNMKATLYPVSREFGVYSLPKVQDLVMMDSQIQNVIAIECAWRKPVLGRFHLAIGWMVARRYSNKYYPDGDWGEKPPDNVVHLLNDTADYCTLPMVCYRPENVAGS